ncbi:hypothetical protein [Streptomyces sp. B1I3]|uniref:hypothetical protein n=1 Tax=Streptomyces sp. B1I3 TaxID=3042264 RepID=UPI00277DB3E9|nr:hypothetical protein [Streptomyces sp. B1I3]MDQ0792175.1 HEAT repeat protein [Streptomyces sp. B1I3]
MSSRYSASWTITWLIAPAPLFCLLHDLGPEIRSRAAYLLAWFPEEGVRSIPELLVQLDRETDPRAAATALVAAGLVGDHALVDRLRPWLTASAPLVRWGAATAPARLVTAGPATTLGEDGLVSQVVAELTRAAAAPMSAPGVDFNDGNLRGYAARSLALLATHAPDATCP